MYTVWLEWGKIDTKSKSKSFFLAFFSFALALSLFVSWAVVAVHIIRLANAWTGFGDASKMRFMSSLLATPIPTIPLHKINWHPETVFSHTITVSTLSLARSGFFALSCSFFVFSLLPFVDAYKAIYKETKRFIDFSFENKSRRLLKLKSNLLLYPQTHKYIVKAIAFEDGSEETNEISRYCEHTLCGMPENWNEPTNLLWNFSTLQKLFSSDL